MYGEALNTVAHCVERVEAVLWHVLAAIGT